MGMTKFAKCKEVLRKILVAQGDKVGFMTLQDEIRKQIGSDEKRTIEPTMKIMLDLGLMRDIGHCHFKINKKEVLQ